MTSVQNAIADHSDMEVETVICAGSGTKFTIG